MEIETRVREIVRQELGLEEDPQLTDRLEDDLGADSLDRYELSFALEQAFDLAIDDQDAAPLQTVGEIVSFVTKKLAKKPSAA